MSRSVARLLHGLTRAITAPQSPRRRAMTLSRLMERLDGESAHVITTKYGPIRTLPLRGPHLAAAALGFDEEEPETLAWIDTMQAGETLWDIGAATGLFSMYAARKGVKVLAFEPKGTSFGVLVEHLALNELGDAVFPLCVALSDETGMTHLSLAQMAAGSGGNSVSGQPDQFGHHHSVFNQGVPAYRIDDFREAFGLAAPDYIKVDVDGVEGLILKGAPQTLPLVKAVLVEVEGQNADEAATRIEPALRAAGFAEDLSVRERGSKRNRLYRREGQTASKPRKAATKARG
ncbi:MAG TPA: FkbM family methyltransferase [Caulobacteraceae bacterium]